MYYVNRPIDYIETPEGDINLLRDFGKSPTRTSFEKKLREQEDGFILAIPVLALSMYRDYLYLCQDCLIVSMFMEELVRVCEKVTQQPWEHGGGYGNVPIFRFKIWCKNQREAASIFYKYCVILSDSQRKESKEFYEEFDKQYAEYKDALIENKFQFPELIDHYYSNLITATYDQYPELGKEGIEVYPHRKFGFWRSVTCKQLGYQVFESSELIGAWIITTETKVSELLSKYMEADTHIEFEKANLLTINNRSYLLGTSEIIHFQMGSLLLARMCGDSMAWDWDLNLPFMGMTNWFTRNFMDRYYESEEYDHWISKMKKIDPDFASKNQSQMKMRFFLSTNGEFSLAIDTHYQYLLWNGEKLDHPTRMKITEEFNDLAASLFKVSGIQTDITCQWNELDDEQFEELCYDVIYHNSRYNSASIRKMGKSRSRDGGRDIVVHTNKTPYKPPQKFIFQCKLVKSESSLSAQKVQDISDLIEQYDADGYGVMTSAVIDATLYDKLDALAGRKNIVTQTYSIYELERFLARYPNIKAKYFNL